jgi:hypothetical protein
MKRWSARRLTSLIVSLTMLAIPLAVAALAAAPYCNSCRLQ